MAEKIEPCQCGSECFVDHYHGDPIVICKICCYRSSDYPTNAEAIAAHNEVASKVRVFDLMMKGSESRKHVMGVALQSAAIAKATPQENDR